MGRYMQAVEPNKRASQYAGVAGDKSLGSACSEMNVEDADNVKYVRAKDGYSWSNNTEEQCKYFTVKVLEQESFSNGKRPQKKWFIL